MLGMQHGLNVLVAEDQVIIVLHRAVRMTFPLCQKNDVQYFIGRCGVSRIRTDDLLLAKQVLYQLSYNPA